MQHLFPKLPQYLHFDLPASPIQQVQCAGAGEGGRAGAYSPGAQRHTERERESDRGNHERNEKATGRQTQVDSEEITHSDISSIRILNIHLNTIENIYI